MRFLCIYKPGTPESNTPPTAEEMAAMGQLIGDMAKAGVLLAAEGCLPSSFGARVRLEASGEFSVTDGPFPETKELVAGFCKDGTSEVRQLHDTPAG
jgi:hypothetical protein